MSSEEHSSKALEQKLRELLQPISNDTPAGTDLIYDPVYDAMREYRREDDSSLPQGIWQTDVKQSDWNALKKQTLDVLKNRSKDLQVAGWLAEALWHTDGLSALTSGWKLIIGLCERFWPTFYPLLDDDDDPEARMSVIQALETRVYNNLLCMDITVPLTNRTTGGTWQLWLNAQALQAIAASRPRDFSKALANGDISTEQFNAAITATPLSFFTKLQVDLQDFRSANNRLATLLDNKCGDKAVSLHKLSDLLFQMTTMIQRILRDRGVTSDSPADTEHSSGESSSSDIVLANTSMPEETVYSELPASSFTIKNRQQAYLLLSKIADYLLVTEPHSPTPYLIKRAVSWGNMPLNELLTELLEEDENRLKIFKLLKINNN